MSDFDPTDDGPIGFTCKSFHSLSLDPPLVERPWVLTEAGRARFIGHRLWCKRCEEDARPPATGGPIQSDFDP